MKKLLFKLFPCALIFLSACSKETALNDIGAKAVVESYLIAGQPIKVSIKEESITGTVDTLVPIENLSVVIINNGTNYTLNYAGNGIYQDLSLIAKEGESYQLRFEYKGKELSALTRVPEKPTGFKGEATTITAPAPPTAGTMPPRPEPVEFSWHNPENNYHLMVVRCIETNPVQISTGGARLIGGGTFRTEPTQTTFQGLTPMQFKYYGLHEIILYRILPEYAALYEDTGSNSNNLTNPPGNITNGLGIFTGVNMADTLYITVN